jgi:hypothetical protein
MPRLSRMRARATYANVTATLALFVALGGGSFAVAALSGSEKKVVKKIAKKQANKRITARAPGLTVEHAGSADVATPVGVATGDLTGTYPDPQIGNNAVNSSKVADNTLSGDDIAESTLGQVPSALLGGVGRRGATAPACDPEDNIFAFCQVSSLFNVPAGGARALVLARLSGASGGGAGRCRLAASSTGVIPDSDQIVSGLENTTLVGVTGPLPPGPTDFGVFCNETGGEMIYGELAVSAVLISTG